MGSLIGFYSPTTAEMTAAEPEERQLALLLKAESLFEAKIAEKGEDSAALFLCIMLHKAGNYYDWRDEPDLLLRMIRASCTEEENQRFIASPFAILAKKKGDAFYREINLHRAFWLDFMILVLADEAGIDLQRDESLPMEVPGVPEDMPVPKGLS